LAEFEALKSQAVAAYEEATGSKWQPRPANGKGQPGKTATAARSKAAGILAK